MFLRVFHFYFIIFTLKVFHFEFIAMILIFIDLWIPFFRNFSPEKLIFVFILIFIQKIILFFKIISLSLYLIVPTFFSYLFIIKRLDSSLIIFVPKINLSHYYYFLLFSIQPTQPIPAFYFINSVIHLILSSFILNIFPFVIVLIH